MSHLMRRDIICKFDYLPRKSDSNTSYYNVMVYNEMFNGFAEFDFHCKSDIDGPERRLLFLKALAHEADLSARCRNFNDWCAETCFDPDDPQSLVKFNKSEEQLQRLDVLFDDAENFISAVEENVSQFGWSIMESGGDMMLFAFMGDRPMASMVLQENGIKYDRAVDVALALEKACDEKDKAAFEKVLKQMNNDTNIRVDHEFNVMHGCRTIEHEKYGFDDRMTMREMSGMREAPKM